MSLCSMGIAITASLGAFEYDRCELYQLVALADRVVLGSISAVQEKTFDLAVEQELFGASTGTTLHLTRFVDWTCASRWAEYAVGQRVLLFLRGDRAMGAGDEGDWPVTDVGVLAPYRIRGYSFEAHHLETGRAFTSCVLEPEELGDAIRRYRECFSWLWNR